MAQVPVSCGTWKSPKFSLICLKNKYTRVGFEKLLFPVLSYIYKYKTMYIKSYFFYFLFIAMVSVTDSWKLSRAEISVYPPSLFTATLISASCGVTIVLKVVNCRLPVSSWLWRVEPLDWLAIIYHWKLFLHFLYWLNYIQFKNPIFHQKFLWCCHRGPGFDSRKGQCRKRTFWYCLGSGLL